MYPMITLRRHDRLIGLSYKNTVICDKETKMSTMIFPIDRGFLLEKPEVLRRLVELYIDIWRYDPNFQEYKMCPECRHYYSHDDVEVQGVSTCSNGHQTSILVEAWDPQEVSEELLQATLRTDFCGAIVVNEMGDILGFAWAESMTYDELVAYWGADVIGLLDLDSNMSNMKCIYFDELALAFGLRGQGLGKSLVHYICNWMRDQHPTAMTMLRTHANSPARYIYEKIGYSIFADDPQYGDGRVLMYAFPCNKLTVELLN